MILACAIFTVVALGSDTKTIENKIKRTTEFCQSFRDQEVPADNNKLSVLKKVLETLTSASADLLTRAKPKAGDEADKGLVEKLLDPKQLGETAPEQYPRLLTALRHKQFQWVEAATTSLSQLKDISELKPLQYNSPTPTCTGDVVVTGEIEIVSAKSVNAILAEESFSKMLQNQREIFTKLTGVRDILTDMQTAVTANLYSLDFGARTEEAKRALLNLIKAIPEDEKGRLKKLADALKAADDSKAKLFTENVFTIGEGEKCKINVGSDQTASLVDSLLGCVV